MGQGEIPQRRKGPRTTLPQTDPHLSGKRCYTPRDRGEDRQEDRNDRPRERAAPGDGHGAAVPERWPEGRGDRKDPGRRLYLREPEAKATAGAVIERSEAEGAHAADRRKVRNDVTL